MKALIKNIIALSLALGIAITVSYASTWTPPTATAPGNNTESPVNVGATSQVKNGNLSVNSFSAYQASWFDQNVSFRGSIGGVTGTPASPVATPLRISSGVSTPTFQVDTLSGSNPELPICADSSGNLRICSISGSCNYTSTTTASTYQCKIGVSSGGAYSSTTGVYSWSCNGISGGTNASCSYCSPTATWVGSCNCPTAGSCFNPSSFLAGTKVAMADGIYKNVEDITEGDMVKTSDGISNIEHVYRYITKEKVYSINGSKYFVTESHPFMTEDGWKSFNPEHTKIKVPDLDVKQLGIGDVLIKENGQKESIESVAYMKLPLPVYNFRVGGVHTFYANGYLVHNK